MTCKEFGSEILENARSGSPGSPALSQHRAHCPHCAERWEAEVELTRGLRHARASVAHLRSSKGARQKLMAEFGKQRRGLRVRLGFVWATAALAGLFVMGVWIQGKRIRHESTPPVQVAQVFADDLMADSDFVPVPYAPPLAPGEYVEVVEAELTPAALARMGFVIQTAGNSEVTMDLMVGEDGLPRAVRVPESAGIRF